MNARHAKCAKHGASALFVGCAPPPPLTLNGLHEFHPHHVKEGQLNFNLSNSRNSICTARVRHACACKAHHNHLGAWSVLATNKTKEVSGGDRDAGALFVGMRAPPLKRSFVTPAAYEKMG